jgi:hypothetical protein
MALKGKETDGMRPQPPSITDPPSSGGVRNPMRPQPPTMRNPPRGESKPWEPGRENETLASDDDEEDEEEDSKDQPNWEKRAKDAFNFSTTYIDSNYRQNWDDSLRAFNNQHPGDSKYNTEGYRKRSKLFVPVTRTVIRKNEAAACQAFFSNQDLISIQAMNEAEKPQVMSAAIMKQLIQYRLTETIPWLKIVVGGLQDAQVQGACIARPRWCYETKKGRSGERECAFDGPQIDLIPIENIRFDPSASWLDPINTSPYLIELLPMFVGDVKDKMAHTDPKGKKWKSYPDSELQRSEASEDSTRQARLNNQQDPNREKREVSDYDVIWIQRHIHRWDGTDYEFYTLSDGRLLTEPDLLENTVFHGQRDYVMGIAMLETHKPIPTSVPSLVKPLQDGINAIENQRNDNVMLVLNKRWKVKRGTNVDTASLIRNVPGGVTSVDNMEDVEEIQWQDITQSAYQEAGAKRQSFDDLIGNFNPMALAESLGKNMAQGSMRMLNSPAAVMTEYMLMTYAITFVQPIIRQLVMLEQHYETDKTVLAIAGQKAQAFQKFGVDEVTDEMLDHGLTTKVNVGMGATDPIAKLSRFITAVQTFAMISAKPPAGVNLAEVWKELMALSGYQDGERFSTAGNQEMAKLEQVNKQLTMMVQDLKRHAKDKHDSNVVKLITNRENNATKMNIAGITHHHEKVQTYAQHILDQNDMVLQQTLQPPPEQGEQQQGQGQAA